MQAICLALLLSLAVASAATCGSVSQAYADKGEACGPTVLCQTSLYCINETCTDVREGDNCTDGFGCGVGNFLQCLNGKCAVTFRAVGDPCDQDAECLSGKCDNTTEVCAATLKNGDACDLTTGTSAWSCPEACIVQNGTSACGAPIPVGGDCTETYLQWAQNPIHDSDWAGNYPEFTCVAGAACILNASTGGYTCQRLFAVPQNKPCQMAGIDGTCLYNLTCQPNATLGAGLYCQPYPAAPAKGYAQCDAASNQGAPQCPFGQACQCSAVGANATCQPFVGGNLCTDYLTDFVKCLAKHGCPYTPALFPFTEDAGQPFSYEAIPHTCAYIECRVEHANFLCCQNNHTMFSGSASGAAKFSPVNTPGDGYCKLHSGWPNWVIPVIVLSGIVVVVSVIVIIYVVARRRPDADYDPINK